MQQEENHLYYNLENLINNDILKKLKKYQITRKKSLKNINIKRTNFNFIETIFTSFENDLYQKLYK